MDTWNIIRESPIYISNQGVWSSHLLRLLIYMTNKNEWPNLYKLNPHNTRKSVFYRQRPSEAWFINHGLLS
jgi:hypothetical protein